LKLRSVAGGLALALTSYEDIFSPNTETNTVLLIPIWELHEYKEHTFRVNDDAAMEELTESIRQSGVMVPGVARRRKAGGYEIIAGHRRRRACELAGLTEMPMIVRELDDDEATIIMADSNLQRDEILPSEKAWTFRKKLEAMKRLTARRAQGGGAQAKSSELLAEQMGKGGSKNQIYRYIRLTELTPDLLETVDAGKLTLVSAVELSYMTTDNQEALAGLMNAGLPAPTLSQAQKLREAGASEQLAPEKIEALIAGNVPAAPPKVTLGAGKLKKYFPSEYTPKQIEDTIVQLLDEWRRRQTEK
jgi:ParB family chromosome partitioning protein